MAKAPGFGAIWIKNAPIPDYYQFEHVVILNVAVLQAK